MASIIDHMVIKQIIVLVVVAKTTAMEYMLTEYNINANLPRVII